MLVCMAVNGQTMEIASNFLWFDLYTCNTLINETLGWCREKGGRLYRNREADRDRARDKEEGS